MAETLDELTQAAELPPQLALREAALLLARLSLSDRVRTLPTAQLPPLLARLSLADRVRTLLASAPAAASVPRFETLVAPNAGWSLQLFIWPRGAATPIHDHTSWGIYMCLAGQLDEDRFIRLDDGSRFGVARLRRDWHAVWRPGEQSSLLPYDGGIHRVHNSTPASLPPCRPTCTARSRAGSTGATTTRAVTTSATVR
jgi:predicted metal-dependent enzyme (double-stranded beta helix superfamily)